MSPTKRYNELKRLTSVCASILRVYCMLFPFQSYLIGMDAIRKINLEYSNYIPCLVGPIINKHLARVIFPLMRI